ncbi:NDUFA6 [Symbiodinium sp. KB8]|nr:NDUFA6 [Symbiodinium sp. KB8]
MALAKTAKALDVQALMRGKVLDLFRRMCRQVPRMVKLYELPYEATEMRHIIGLLFKKNAHVQGEMEMEETLMQWKQRGHVLHLLSLDDADLGAAEETDSIVDNQAWIAELVERVELASGQEVDTKRLGAILRAARARELGSMPGEALAPAATDTVSAYVAARKGGSKWAFDQITALQSEQGAGTNPAVNAPRNLDLSKEQRHLKELRRQALWNDAVELEWGKGPWVRPPAAVEKKGLPLWVASKVHWSWVDYEQDGEDSRVQAAIEGAKDDLMSKWGADTEAYEAHLAEAVRETDKDALRWGRVR